MKTHLLKSLITRAAFISAAMLALVGASTVYAASFGIEFRKDPSSKLFTITIRASRGINEFSIKPAGDKLPYGGSYNGCPTSRLIDNVLFSDPIDFDPQMEGLIVDCDGSKFEFTVPKPNKDGVTSTVSKTPEKAPAAGTKVAAGEETKAGKPGTQAVKTSGGFVQSSSRKEALSKISYPVPELGNCKNENDCHDYCSNPSNLKSCTEFAEQHQLMSKEDADRAKSFAKALDERGGGPGGCKTEEDCQNYCEAGGRASECVDFAEQYGLLSADELAQLKKYDKITASGDLGGCKSERECRAYCDDPEHIDECLNLAEQYDLIPKEELAEAKKFLPLIKAGQTPGACKTKAQCEAFCSEPDNVEQCINFAVEHDILPKEEADMAKKFLPFIKSGQTPGACKTKAQCEAYCDAEDHLDECLDFASKAGFISPEEIEIAKKTGGKGPGGCKSRESCEAFCKTSEHLQECQDFAKSAGIEIKFNGPGGCKSIEECTNYCTQKEHNEECAKFAKESGFAIPEGLGGGGGPGGFSGGPGGCKSPEECTAYCTKPENAKECQSFAPSGGPQQNFGAEQGENNELRSQLFEKERLQHLENVKKEDSKIVNCAREKLGEEVWGRRQEGKLKNKEEGLLVENILRSCGANFIERWISVIKSGSDEDRKCLEEKLGNETVQTILGGQEVPGSSWAIESECRFLGVGKGSLQIPKAPQSDRGPTEEQLKQYQQQYQKQYEQELQKYQQPSPSSSNSSGEPSQDQYKQYQEQYQKQYEEQYKKEYQYPKPAQ